MHKGMSDMIGGKSKNLELKMEEIKTSFDTLLSTTEVDADINAMALKSWIYYLYGLKNGNNASVKNDKFKFTLEDLLFLNTNGEIHELEMSLSRYRFKMPKKSASTSWQKW